MRGSMSTWDSSGILRSPQRTVCATAARQIVTPIWVCLCRAIISRTLERPIESKSGLLDPTALDNALILVRERAGRRDITLQSTVDERLGEVRADERKIRQVVLNLLSNAIKFTPEGGRIEVRAVPVDGSVEVSVTDTGVGIAPEDQEAVFEEFRQVGTSAVGAGSTFTFRLPVRP